MLGNANGVWMNGTAYLASKGSGLRIENNTIKTFYNAILISNQSAPLITKNIITRSDSLSNVDFFGIAANFISGAAEYSQNRILAHNGNFGLRLRGNIGTPSNEILVVNNFVQTGGSSNSRGISLEDSGKYINVANNSVLTLGSNATLSRTLNITMLNAPAGNSINLYNNIFVNDGNGYATYVSNVSTGAVSNSDHNNYYAKGTILGFWAVNTNTLQAYITASEKDSNSYSTNPFFVSNAELRTNSAVLNNSALPLSYVTVDIDGETRHAGTPDIGADEYTPVGAELMTVEILYPGIEQSGCGIPNDSVVFVIRNVGAVEQSNFDVKAEITGDITASLSKTVADTLQPGDYYTVTINGYNSKVTGLTASMELKVYTDLTGDSNRSNDTLQLSTTLNPSPLPPSIVNAGDACMGGSAVITASSPAPGIYWYDAPIGGTELGDGPTFITPALTENTTFYVDASNSTLEPHSVGHVNAGTASFIAQTSFYGLAFTVHEQVNIDTMYVYPTGTGTISIVIYEPGTMNIVHSAPVANISGNAAVKNAVYIGANLAPGNYRVSMTSVGITNLIRESGGATFPYVSAPITITHSMTSSLTGTTTSSYYWFYDWKVTKGAKGCASDRVPVSVTVHPKVNGSLVNQSTPFDGTYNAGTIASPDKVCVNNTLAYQISAPTGYQPADYGTTWNVSNAELRYLSSGGLVSGTFNVSNNTWSYTPVTSDMDSVVRFRAKVVNIVTGCDSLLERIIKVESFPQINLGIDTGICQGQTVVLTAPLSLGYVWSTGATTRSITVSNSGTYSVTITNAAGCTASDDIVINVNPLPQVNLGPDTTLCAGSAIVLDAGTPGATYLWSTGETTQTIVVSTSGIYTVNVTTAEANCTGSDDIMVIVNVAPVVNLGADKSICPGDSVLLDAGNPNAAYLWSTGETTRTIYAKDSGTYTVTVTNTLNCSSSDDIYVGLNPTPLVNIVLDSVNNSLRQAYFNVDATLADVQYQWNFGDGSSGGESTPDPSHIYQADGNYLVSLKTTFTAGPGVGCSYTDTMTVSIKLVIAEGTGKEQVSRFQLTAKPNPFMERTTIAYTLPNASNVSLEVYDMLGRRVSTIVSDELQHAGTHEQEYINEDQFTANGMYMIRLIVNGQGSMIRVVDLSKK